MRLLMKWLAPVIFGVGYLLFRSPFSRRSKMLHTFTMKIFRLAAENGNTQALSLYGHLLHFKGEGQQSRIQGAIYLEQAAKAGDSKAQYQMGRIYEAGFEHYFVPCDERALHYYQLSAKQGHRLAITRLIAVYQQGELSQPADTIQYQYWQGQQAPLV